MSFTISDSRVVQSRKQAILVDAPELDEPMWVPKSQIDDDSEVYSSVGQTGDLIVTEWYARKKGWI